MGIGNFDRRRFLKLGGAMSVFGAGAPFAMQLAAATAATASQSDGYRAIVCVFLAGGNDGVNTVLATDQDSWGRYFSARNAGDDPIALMPPGTPRVASGKKSPITGRIASPVTPEFWGGVLPIVPNTAQAIPDGTNASNRTFALHPFLGPLKSLFDRGKLAVVANLGTLIAPITKDQYNNLTVPVPPALFSHNDQQAVWQSGNSEGARVGWGGSMADILSGYNGSGTTFTAIAPGGTTVFLAGKSVRQYIIETTGNPGNVLKATNSKSLFGSTLAPNLINSEMTDIGSNSIIAADYGPFFNRSIQRTTTVNTAVSSSPKIPPAPNYINPYTGASQVNRLALQLQAVAKIIAAAPILQVKRQVFFVQLPAFDSHLNQNQLQPDLLGQLAQGLDYFDRVLSNLGGADLSNSVTTFTASDFGRTFTTNGSGTDHAWGSHHFVMGGAVKGGTIYGQFPTLGIDLGSFYNPDMAGNYIIPTTAVDQYAATFGAWLGVSSSDLASIFPNLTNFSAKTLSFL